MATPPQEWPTRVDDTLVQRGAPPPGTPPPYPPEEPDSPIGRGMLLALVVLALAVVGALAAWILTHRGGTTQTRTVVVNRSATPSTTNAAPTVQRVTVPQVVGLRKQAAIIKIGSAGLKPKLEVRTTGPRDGLVAEQRPPSAQKVRLGTAVVLLVDRAPAPMKKPKAAAPAKQAQPKQVTTTAAAQTTTVQQATTTTAAQTPTPTPAPAPAPAQATVPDVSGKAEQAAVDALAKAGLLVNIVFVPSSDDLGTVEGQSKQSGTTVPAQSHVQINLSGGNGKFPPETVPNVIGKTLQDAVSTLNGAQLRLIYEKLPVTSKASVGKIVQQSPLAGNKAPQHAQVLVYLGVLKP